MRVLEKMSLASLKHRFYPDPRSSDPLVHFTELLEEHLRPEYEVLDLGAGAGELNSYRLKGRVNRIVGVDLDPRVKENPLLDEGVVADLTHLPFSDRTFDLVFSIYVLEHIMQPVPFLNEIARVLRPGGYCLFLTPNRFHYVPLIASVTPIWFHRWFNRKRGRADQDTFPTYYRLNSRRALRHQFACAGFEPIQLRTIEVAPHYLTFSTPTFLLGVAYERLVNASAWLSGLRVGILGSFRRQQAVAPVPITSR
jgi:SAM-dependent methyltransferase